MGKDAIRRRYLAARKAIPPALHSLFSLQAQQLLISSDGFARARRLALYSPVGNEVATAQLFAAARAAGKKVYYPQARANQLCFREVNEAGQLLPGRFGILEPGNGDVVAVSELDLMVIPGVAFDLHGSRLGYGRGFYDRILAGTTRPVSVGLCFESQLYPCLPQEDHDRKLMFLATEARLITCRVGQVENKLRKGRR